MKQICRQRIAPERLERHVNECLDSNEFTRSEDLANIVAAGVADIIDVDSFEEAPPQCQATALRSGDSHVHSAVEVGSASRGESESQTLNIPVQVEERDIRLPAPLPVDRARMRAESGLAGMEVLRNVATRMATQYTLSRIRALHSFHISSNFNLHHTTISGIGWDCGYRNVAMLCSSILKDRTTDLVSVLARSGMVRVPSVEEIQCRIEAAWGRGFDEDGARHYGFQLLGKKSWIGAVEVAIMFRAMGIRAQVVDFLIQTDGDRQVLLDWVWDYFASQCRAGACLTCRNSHFGRDGSFIPPLYFQHEGHSRTIAGAERLQSSAINMLVVDPLRSFSNQLRNCEERGTGMAPMMRRVRVGKDGLTKREYQICFIPPSRRKISASEYDSAKDNTQLLAGAFGFTNMAGPVGGGR